MNSKGNEITIQSTLKSDYYILKGSGKIFYSMHCNINYWIIFCNKDLTAFGGEIQLVL